MSSDPILLAEVEALRAAVEVLRVRVGILERSRAAESQEVAAPSEFSYSVVSAAVVEPPYPRSGGLASGIVDVEDSEARLAVAQQIGCFLRRCVEGRPRGSSGRDRVRLPNTCYVIVGDFTGRILEVPRFEESFAEVRRICKKGPDCGRSIFVGFPSAWEARAALEAGSFLVPPQLRDVELDPFLELLVDEAGSTRHHYEVVNFTWEKEGERLTANLIPICRFHQRLIVAVPGEAWHRTVSSRLLPRGALAKPIFVEVATALHSDPEVALLDKAKLWLGYLARDIEEHLVPGRDAGAKLDVWYDDAEDGELRIPLAQALADAAEEHYGFMSAKETAAPKKVTTETRLSTLESSLEKIHEALNKLAGVEMPAPGGTEGAPAAPSVFIAAPKVVPRRVAAQPSAAGDPLRVPGLDPGVVASAVEAGIPADQIRKLGALAGRPGRMLDAPTKPKPHLVEEVLGETDEEGGAEAEEAVEGGGDPTAPLPGGPLEQAVVQLTKIVGKLSSRQRGDLEALLDGADSGSTEPSLTTGSKSKAAAYVKLKACLQENPSYIYTTIEERMDADFSQLRAAPGATNLPTGSRAWVEYRSRVMNYQSSVRAIWAIAGIHDCLRHGRYQEARCRATLAIAAWDQASLDSGNWLMSQELLLEEPPPWSSFQNKRMPEPWEQAASKLVDERWLAVLQWRLKDKDAYLETKKRLVQSRGRADPKDGDKQDSLKGKKGDGKKGGGRGKSSAEQSDQ